MDPDPRRTGGSGDRVIWIRVRPGTGFDIQPAAPRVGEDPCSPPVLAPSLWLRGDHDEEAGSERNAAVPPAGEAS